MSRRVVERLLQPAHMWRIGRGGRVMLLEPPANVVAEHAVGGAPLLFLSELWVPPRERGRGHAGALLTAATEWAQSAKTDLWLYIAPNGPAPRLSKAALQQLYTNFGFYRVAFESPDIEMAWRYARS